MTAVEASSGAALHVMALVGSAGGLDAVSTVLEQLPDDLDAAVVVLIHQQPDRENRLIDLLASRTTLPVRAATHGRALRSATVVVAPPGRHLLVTPGPRLATIVSGVAPPNRPSADLLLTTLAIACGPRATAVVLSGGGHDGATGATAIHDFGGTVLASDEASSTNFSMPGGDDRARQHDRPHRPVGRDRGAAGVDRERARAVVRKMARGGLSQP